AESGFWSVVKPSATFPCQDRVLQLADEAIEQAALVTAITVEWIPLSEGARRDFETRYPRQAQETAWAAEAIRSDFEQLTRLHPGTGKELGGPIDPAEDGDLGPLWPAGKPRWFEELSPAVLPARLSLVVPITNRQKPEEVRAALAGSPGSVDVLCLTVGPDPTDFQATPAALAWVKDFCSSALPGPSPSLIVLASPSPTVSADQEQQARLAL